MKRKYIIPQVTIITVSSQQVIAWSRGLGVEVSGTTKDIPAAKCDTQIDDFDYFEEEEQQTEANGVRDLSPL